MHTPLRITFQNTPSSDAIRQLIEQQAEHLEQHFERMTDCHVIFKLPDGHHRSGGHYEVAIHLKMPGVGQVDIDRTSSPDDRLADPQFAVSDAFRRAHRRLQDRAKVMRHEVKALHKRIDRTLDQADES